MLDWTSTAWVISMCLGPAELPKAREMAHAALDKIVER